MKTNFDKSLTDHSAENRTWIMGLTFASIVMVLGLFILPFIDEMTGDTKPAQRPQATPTRKPPIQRIQLPEDDPLLSPLANVPTGKPLASSANLALPGASMHTEEEKWSNLPLSETGNVFTPAVEKDAPPETVEDLDLSFLSSSDPSPDSNPVIPAMPLTATAPGNMKEAQDTDIIPELETIHPLPENRSLAEPFLNENPSEVPPSSPASSNSSPIFKIVSDAEIDQLSKPTAVSPPPETDSEPVSMLTREIQAQKSNRDNDSYNNSLIQKYRRKNPSDPATNKELTEAMGDYYKQEGTFFQYAEKFPDWVAQYNEIKKNSTGPVLFRP
jgi:hypothetical protein